MTILITGDMGMIGSQLVKGLLCAGHTVVGIDREDNQSDNNQYHHFSIDLSDKEKVKEIVKTNKPDRIIHLAALAHTEGVQNLTWDNYKRINVDCSQNVFDAAGECPVLFISTVDVYGFYDGRQPVTPETEIHPVSCYARSKALAEEACRKLKHYSIFRFSPVYTDEIKRDIQKRYYLFYPKIAYRIGKGTLYEVLNISTAVKEMVDWCGKKTHNEVRIIKDSLPLWTPDSIRAEQKEGRANIVLHFPEWLIHIGYSVLKSIFGENEKVYLLNKAVHPLRSSEAF